MNKELFRIEVGKKITDVIINEKDTSGSVKFIFDNNEEFSISDYHSQDCCENVYADFSVIRYQEDELKGRDIEQIVILGVEDAGFLICFYKNSENSIKIFVPCYNEQNGYYSSSLSLMINGLTKIDIGDCVIDKIS